MACFRLITRPRCCRLTSTLPLFISAFNASLSDWKARSRPGSFDRTLSPPGPRIAAFPAPMSSRTPPRTGERAARGAPGFNARWTAFEIAWARPLSAWEEAYITTKNAKSKAMKSAYDTSQRAWFSARGVRFRKDGINAYAPRGLCSTGLGSGPTVRPPACCFAMGRTRCCFASLEPEVREGSRNAPSLILISEGLLPSTMPVTPSSIKCQSRVEAATRAFSLPAGE